MITEENIMHTKPANATVVNLGVSFLHLSDVENIAKPKAEINPNNRPKKLPELTDPNAIITIPIDAITIEIQVFMETFSFKNKNPKIAVKNGIAAKHKSVIAVEVFVIDHINVIIAEPSPKPPIIPETPIFK